MKKFSKVLAVTLAAFMLVSAFSVSVSAHDIRQWKDSQNDLSLLDITEKIKWESGTFNTGSDNVQTTAAASDQIRVAMNFDAGQLYVKCKPGYQVKFAECINNEGTLTVKRKYSWDSFPIPQQQWLDFTYINTYADRDYTLIVKSTSGAALNPAKAKDYVTVSEVDVRYHVPDYYVDHLVEKTYHISDLMDKPNSFSFIFISDIHLQHNTKHSPAMIRYIKNQCGISEVLGGGDFVTAWLNDGDGIYGLWDDMEELKYIFDGVPMFKTLGNHEWGYGSNNQWNITNEQAYNRFYRDYDAYDKTVVYNETRQYFYNDDPVNKMRYISLNGMDYESHKILADYTDNNFTQNKTMWFEISDEQVNWLKNEAFDLPSSDWSCLILTHVPIFTNAAESPWGKAYTWGNDGVSSTGATDNLRNAISEFASSGKGNFIGMFNGHSHRDALTKINGFNVYVTDGDTVISSDKTRTINTITEQEFNVVTVCPEERTVYVTKIGAGEDVSFTY